MLYIIIMIVSRDCVRTFGVTASQYNDLSSDHLWEVMFNDLRTGQVKAMSCCCEPWGMMDDPQADRPRGEFVRK